MCNLDSTLPRVSELLNLPILLEAVGIDSSTEKLKGCKSSAQKKRFRKTGDMSCVTFT